MNNISFKLKKFSSNTPIQQPKLVPISNSNIVIVMDQLIAYHNLPPLLLKLLPGYNAFKNRGIEFTNIHVNRQMCSPSRSTILTSTINTGIQSNIDLPFQYPYKSHLDYDAETIPKSLKKAYPNLNTAYFGKEHLSQKLDTGAYSHPSFELNTTGVYKCYGFDKGTMFGDSFYRDGHGFASDNLMMNTVLNNVNAIKDKNLVDYIEIDPITRERVGYVGVLPYLKARAQDKKQFHMQCHIVNPHDTQDFYSNFTDQDLLSNQSQFWAPFLNEQTSAEGAINPYAYDEYFTDAYVKIHNMIENHFEKNYNSYKTYKDKLPFINSYINDYALNSDNEQRVSAYLFLKKGMTMADDENDIKTWKNLINNYYGLVIEADKYVLKIFNLLKRHNMNNVSVVIISDHGDLMSAHGLKQKGFPFKECVNIPCVIYSPHIQRNLWGTKCSVLGSLIDIAPTIDILMGISQINNKFLGTSLLQRQNNKLIPRTTNVPVMNVFNDYLASQACLVNPNYTKPFVEYKFCFTMIIDYKDDKLIKFGRYFNIIGLLEYQLRNVQIPFSIFQNVSLELIPTSLISSVVSQLNSFIEDSIYNNANTFDFKTLYNIVRAKNNHMVTLLLFLIVYKYSKSENGELVILPYVNDNFIDIKDDINTDFICYNVTDDYDEINNLYLTDYENNVDLFIDFNNRLNNLSKEKCMTTNNKFEFFVPTLLYELTLLTYIKHGTNYTDYNDTVKILINTSYFMNNYDSRISPDLIRNTFINNLTSHD
jgi:arylsulfatase A-like enzyme